MFRLFRGCRRDLVLLAAQIDCIADRPRVAAHNRLLIIMAGGATSNMILFIIYSMAAGILSQRLEKYTKIPYTVLLTVFGIACDVVLQDSIFDHASDSWEKIDLNVLLAIFIMPLVFESALKVHFFIFDKAKYQIFLLGMPILGLSTLLTGITLKALVLSFGESVATLFTWNHSFLLGTILSATDPVAVVALLEHVGASPVLSTTIEGESPVQRRHCDGSVLHTP